MFVGDSLVSLPLWCALWSSAWLHFLGRPSKGCPWCKWLIWINAHVRSKPLQHSLLLFNLAPCNFFAGYTWHREFFMLSCAISIFLYFWKNLIHFHSSWLKECWNNVNFIAASPRVSIIMGSDSDLNVMKDAEVILKKFNIPVEVWFLQPFSFQDNLLFIPSRVWWRCKYDGYLNIADYNCFSTSYTRADVWFC